MRKTDRKKCARRYWIVVVFKNPSHPCSEPLIGAVHIRMTFAGDVGMVMMWLWEGLPYDLFAALAAITLVWVIEARKPLAWVGALAALYVYGEGLHAWRTLTHGWHEAPRDIRLHRGFDAGDYPDARVSYCWHLVDDTFRRAKGGRRVTGVKSPLHSLTLVPAQFSQPANRRATMPFCACLR